MYSRLLFLFVAISAANAAVLSIDYLEYDENDHLKQHWILHTQGCGELGKRAWMDENLMSTAVITDEFAQKFSEEFDDCFAVRLTRGTPKDLVYHTMPEEMCLHATQFQEWLKYIERIEIGWISYWANDCIVYWISADNQRREISILKPGERDTFWTVSYLGHRFEIVDGLSKELIGKYRAEYDSFFPIGELVLPYYDSDEAARDIERELKSVYFEPNAVKRTFTEFGFKKGKLPPDVWSSISAYYYNNKDHAIYEEQIKGSVFINWWEAECLFIGMPWGLKGRWQKSLQRLVQNWIGHDIPLETSDIYGIRRYHEGSRLLSHVDRITTHAVSLIINIAQGGVRTPWYVEIYDFAGRLHEIEMQPGDIVYYESAKCLHGRMKPLNGSYYANIFSHYRPIGDPEWYKKSNPPGTPIPLIDIGECHLEPAPSVPEAIRGYLVKCDRSDVTTLSPSFERLDGSDALYRWWSAVSPGAEELTAKNVRVTVIPDL